MPVPDTKLFEEFLRGTRLVAVQPSSHYLVFSEATSRRGAAQGTPTVYLQYPDMTLTIEAVLGVVVRELQACGCIADLDVALAVLGLMAESRSPEDNAVAHANACLSTIHSVELFQVLVLPTSVRGDYEVRFGSTTLGAFDPTRLLYWARRAKVSFADDLMQDRHALAIMPGRSTYLAIDWRSIPRYEAIVQKWGAEVAVAALYDAYYQAVAACAWQEAATAIQESQVVLEGGGLAAMAEQSLLWTPFARRVALFTWSGSAGVCGYAITTNQSGLHFNLPPPTLIQACRRWLRDACGFSELTGKPFDQTIRTYCRFLQRARRHWDEGHVDEAFLHFIIALDLLWGVRDSSTERIANLTATVVHLPLGQSLEDSAAALRRLYGKRSKYVHEGQAVGPSELQSSEEVCAEVLWALLTASTRAHVEDVSEWARTVGFVNAALMAGREVHVEDWARIGVIHGRGRPPARLRHGNLPADARLVSHLNRDLLEGWPS